MISLKKWNHSRIGNNNIQYLTAQNHNYYPQVINQVNKKSDPGKPSHNSATKQQYSCNVYYQLFFYLLLSKSQDNLFPVATGTAVNY